MINIPSTVRKAAHNKWMGFPGIRKAPPGEEGAGDPVAARYREAVALWMDLYRGEFPWRCPDYEKSLNLPALIAAEVARCAVLEMEVLPGHEDPGALEQIQALLADLLGHLRGDLELACAGGSLAWLPREENGVRTVETVSAERLSGHQFDRAGHLVGITVSTPGTDSGGRRCMLSEQFRLRPEGGVEIARSAWRLPYPDDVHFGAPVSYTAWEPMEPGQCADWGGLPLRELHPAMERLPLTLFVLPGRWVGSDRPYGCSVFARAVDLIRDADLQFSRYQWEFEGGELAIDASEDLFHRSKAGLELPTGKARLFRTNLLDGSGGGPLMEIFSPALREEPLRRGLTLILTHIEDLCSMTRGSLSDAGDYYDRTATEIRQSRQRFYGRIAEIQKQLAGALNDLLAACGAAGILPLGGSIRINFGDSTIEDASEERVRDLAEVQAGVMTVEEFRRKYFLGGRLDDLAPVHSAAADDVSGDSAADSAIAEEAEE